MLRFPAVAVAAIAIILVGAGSALAHWREPAGFAAAHICRTLPDVPPLHAEGVRHACAGFGVPFIMAAAEGQTPADALTLTARQQEIFRTVLAANGRLTRSMHREFWSSVQQPEWKDPRNAAAVAGAFEGLFLTTAIFQREVWTSVKISAEAGKVVKTSEYEAVKARILAEDLAAEDQDAGREATDNAEELLRLAAAKMPMKTPDGDVPITAALADQVLAGLDGSIRRARMLLNPVWTGE